MDIVQTDTHDSSSGASSMHSNVNSNPRKRKNSDDSPIKVSQPSKQLKVRDNSPLSLAEMIAMPQSTPTPEEASTIMTKTNMTRSIYISPFKPMIEPSHILNHLKSIDDLKHIAPGIVCTKLLSNTIKNGRISFVSFKLDLGRQHYEMVIDPAYWPMNDGKSITIQEFVDKRAPTSAVNPFSLPPQTQRQGTGQQAANSNGNFQRLPANAHNSNGSGKGDGNGNSNRQQNNTGNSNAQGHCCCQNFQNYCQNRFCERPMPHCNQFRGPYDENRSGRRRHRRSPSNRR